MKQSYHGTQLISAIVRKNMIYFQKYVNDIHAQAIRVFAVSLDFSGSALLTRIAQLNSLARQRNEEIWLQIPF